MAGFDELVPEHVRKLGRYVPGKPLREAERESGVRCIKLASNENPFGPSPRAIDAMRGAAPHANFYPDNQNSELARLIAEQNGLAPENILVTAGSTAFLHLICRTLLAPGLNAVTSRLSFIVYPVAVQSAGAQLIEAPTRDVSHGYQIDLDAVAAAITPATRVIFLANPNNPTGSLLPPESVDRFLDRLPQHVLLVLDEAYCDFATDFARRRGQQYTRSLDYIRANKRVVVLRTFSKAHGLAGLRIGYGMAPAELMCHFARMRVVFSVSNVAEAAAIAALTDAEHSRRTIENNFQQSEFLLSELRAFGLRALPTNGNFIYFEVPEPAAEVARRIQAAGVIVRPLAPWGAPNAIRATIGTPEQNQMFVSALKKSLQLTVAS